MAVLSAIIGGLTAAAAAVGTATSLKAAHDSKKAQKAQKATPTYNAEAEKRKAAEQEANANRRRALGETDTIRTSALGNTEGTAVQKKTVLGG